MRTTAIVAAALLAVGSVAAAGPAGKTARCVIKTSDPSDYSGPCLFTLGPKGSFGLAPVKGRFLVDPFTSLSVYLVAPDKAEVRGLTKDGINSRWGGGEAVQARSGLLGG